jgi:hypothetical protein
MDRLNNLKVKPRFDSRSQASQDQTTASGSSSSAILPGSSTTAAKIDVLHRQPTQFSDQPTALVSTSPPPRSHVTESDARFTTAAASLSETTIQLTSMTSGQTASQGSSRLEAGISAQPGSLPHSGFFAGAKDVDASYGNFTDVGRDNVVNIDIAGNLNIKVGNQVCCEVILSN